MAVDETSLERIRKATFPSSRRGYDKREVEKFLNRLADWLETGGGDQARSDTVRRELERVGERTGSILSEAEESAQQIRGEAEREATEMVTEARASADRERKEADSYSAEARAAADGYSKETRADADTYADQKRADAEREARETIAAAQAKAQRTIDDGIARRKDIEAVIDDLVQSRDQVITEIEGLSDELLASTAKHKPASQADDPFTTPETLDPRERGEGEEPASEDHDFEEPEAAPVDEAADESDGDGTQTKRRRRRRSRAGSSKKR